MRDLIGKNEARHVKPNTIKSWGDIIQSWVVLSLLHPLPSHECYRLTTGVIIEYALLISHYLVSSLVKYGRLRFGGRCVLHELTIERGINGIWKMGAPHLRCLLIGQVI